MTGKGSLDFSNIDEIFDYAMGKEKEAFDFYKEWAVKVDRSAMKDVFEEFAAEEANHIKILQDLKEGTAGEEAGAKAVDLQLTDHLIEVAPTSDMTYKEALRVAIQREKEAIGLYSGAAAASASSPVRSTFEQLANEEVKHKVKLEAIYDDSFYPED